MLSEKSNYTMNYFLIHVANQIGKNIQLHESCRKRILYWSNKQMSHQLENQVPEWKFDENQMKANTRSFLPTKEKKKVLKHIHLLTKYSFNDDWRGFLPIHLYTKYKYNLDDYQHSTFSCSTFLKIFHECNTYSKAIWRFHQNPYHAHGNRAFLWHTFHTWQLFDEL